MMNQAREQEVWDRVMAASAGAPSPERKTAARARGLTEETLLELLADEAGDAGTYRAMAARADSRMHGPLEQLSREEQDHYRQLSAVFFLLTGRRPVVERPKTMPAACTPETLRERYQAEVAGAARYHSLAENAGSFDGTFHSLGCAEERHAQTILRLLQALLS